MNRRNYARELNRLIEKNGSTKPRLLLHACCGPCSSSVLEYLADRFEITVLWFNPNLYPESEFFRRLDTLHEVIEKMSMDGKVNVMEMPWRNEEYENIITDEMKKEGEGGNRCEKCFELRLYETARIAKKKGFDYFCTTLTVSRHKNAVLINDIGESIAEKTGVSWLPSDFKKKNGENRSQQLSEEMGIYRQVYCGCRYSLEKRQEH